MTTHRIDLHPCPNGYGKTPFSRGGKLIGSSNAPEFAAARWLLDNNAAAPDDRLETYRGETLCMSGIVGKLAKLTVKENDHGNPSLQFAPYKAFPTDAVGSRTAKKDISEE